MSLALLALSLCTFALGFAEFVAVSLVPSIASDTGMSVGAVGMMIGGYALGVAIGAPTLSAWLARAPRRRVLAISMFVFALANAVTAATASLPVLLASRFVAGLMHGVVLALAASTAAAAAKPGESGNAIAIVFGGLTVALVLGVPLGTFAGTALRWQVAFAAVGAIALLGAVALACFGPASVATAAMARRASAAATISDRHTLLPVAITALTYAGSFTGFTYVSVLIAKATLLGPRGVAALFIVYGVSAAIGNAVGGQFVDRVGSRAATWTVIGGLFVAIAGAALGAGSPAAMTLAMSVWGLASFGAVPILQKTVLDAAQRNPLGSPELASGMNIAAFNVGIAAGSTLGGFASHLSLVAPMWVAIAPLLVAAVLARRLASRTAATASPTPSLIEQGL